MFACIFKCLRDDKDPSLIASAGWAASGAASNRVNEIMAQEIIF